MCRLNLPFVTTISMHSMIFPAKYYKEAVTTLHLLVLVCAVLERLANFIANRYFFCCFSFCLFCFCVIDHDVKRDYWAALDSHKKKKRLKKLQQPTFESTARAKLVVLLIFLPSFFVLANFADERVKGIINSHSGFSGRFNKWHTVLLRHISRLVHVDGPRLEITLVANENHRDFFGILYALNLLSIRSYIFETFGTVDCKHQQKALASSHVLVPHGRVLLLTGRVQDVQQARFTVNHDLLPVGVLDRRIVLIHEVILDELYREGGLAHASGAHHHQFVLRHCPRFAFAATVYTLRLLQVLLLLLFDAPPLGIGHHAERGHNPFYLVFVAVVVGVGWIFDFC